MTQSITPRARPDSDPDVDSTLRQIEDSLIRSPVPEDFFPEFDRIASTLLQYDRMAIWFNVNGRYQIEYAYVSGTAIENFERGSIHDISEKVASAWFVREEAHYLSEILRQSGNVFEVFNTAARSVGLHSVIVAPIRWRGVSIGSLILRSCVEEAYTDRDLPLIEVLANKISGVVANAQAVSQTRLESRLRESLLELSRLVSSVRSLHEIQERFGEIACSLVSADHVAISVPDEVDQVIENVLVYGHEVEGCGRGSRTLEYDFDAIPWLQSESPYIVDETTHRHSHTASATEQIVSESGLNSTLVAPIVWQRRTIGAIIFRACAEAAFNKYHLKTAAAVADQVAGAIANQIAYQDLRRESRTRDLLAKISRAVSSSQKLDSTSGDLGRLITSLIPSDRLSITLLAEPGEPPSSVYQFGVEFEGTAPGVNPPVKGDIRRMLLDNPVPTVIDVESHNVSGDVAATSVFAEQAGLHSWMVAPLIWRDELLGVIHFRSRQKLAYGNIELDLAGQVSLQVAGSIAGNIAFQKLEDDATVRDVLAELSNAVGSSDNLATVLPQIEILTGSVIEFDGITIGTYDAERETVRDIYSQGVRAATQPVEPIFSISDMISGDAIKAGEVQNVSISSIGDIRHRSRSAAAFRAGTRSFLTAPLISNDRVVGSLQLRSKTENAYFNKHIGLIKRIADQIAGAFANSLATERIRLQAAALESADNAIVITDAHGIIEWVNPAFTKMCGWSSDEAIGQHTSIMKSSDPADQSINDEIWEALGKGRSWNGTHSSRKKDGSEYPEEITVTPVFDRDGEIIHVIGIKQDITERVRAEQQNEDAIRIESEIRELQRIAAARSEFLSTVSHELRTPLTTVSAFTDILFNSNSENLTDRQKTHLGLIRKSSNQLASLIDDLLDVSQADSGRLVINKAKFGLAEMVDEVADLSRVLLSERDQSLDLTNLDSPVELLAERSRVIQILTNLLTNASKYSDPGSTIRLKVSVDHDNARFTITDRGQGMSKVDKAMMFSPFYRGANSQSRETDGTGLGLSVVKSLVDLHDGEITVKSKIGKGTSITVSLPGLVSASS